MVVLFLFNVSVLDAQRRINLEAEEAGIINMASIDSDNSGFTGSGFVNYNNSPGGFIAWDIKLHEAANTELLIRFANGGSDSRPISIILNGKIIVKNLPFESTIDWISWKIKILPLKLQVGNNNLRLESSGSDGGPNVDRIELVSNDFPENFSPVANDDYYDIFPDVPLKLNFLANDSDYDQDDISIVSTGTPRNGSIIEDEDNVMWFVPNKGFIGDDSLNYIISDGALEDTGKVVFSVKFIDWSESVIESTLKRYTPSSFDPWAYATALYLEGMYRTYIRTGDSRYYSFIHQWADLHIDNEGNIDKSINRLDDLLPGIIALHMYYQTDELKFKKAAENVRKVYNTYPRTTDNGFWHMQKKPNELWLDGLYMSMPFLVRYGKTFGEEEYCYAEAIHQYKTYASHLQDEETGLLFHAYDEDGSEPWATPPDNHSGEFWGRSVGWFVMGLVEILEIIPEDFEGREDLLVILEKALNGLANYQDKETGLWYQVINKGENPDNWLETSCSMMYSYAIKRAVQRGYVSDSLEITADKGWAGVLTKISIHSDNLTYLVDICEGTGVGDYTFYINRAKLVNNNHGLGAFLIMNELFANQNIFIDDLNRANPDKINNYTNPNRKSEVEIFPNPLTNEAQVSFFLENSSQLSIEIYSINGQRVLTKNLGVFYEGYNKLYIETEILEEGLWFGRINSSTNPSKNFKFIKIRK